MLVTVITVLLIILTACAANALPDPNRWGGAIRILSLIILVVILIEVLLPLVGHPLHLG